MASLNLNFLLIWLIGLKILCYFQPRHPGEESGFNYSLLKKCKLKAKTSATNGALKSFKVQLRIYQWASDKKYSL